MRTDTRVHLYKTYILTVLLHGCETWTVTRTQEKRLDAFVRHLVFAENFMNSTHQAHYQRDSPEYHQVLASFR